MERMPMPQPHLILIGGFLGAGKTTAIVALARWLGDQGIRAGFITNDQGQQLVDTEILRAEGLATEEIAGGCFCCRFDDLMAAGGRLSHAIQPDVLVAEAVGSCTDLVATVVSPIRRLAGEQWSMAPVSVVVDPVRARAMLAGARRFDPDIEYIYGKQLEEADCIVISKTDLLQPSEVVALADDLRLRYPRASVFATSAVLGEGLDPWFGTMLYGTPAPRETMTMDYDRYAEGEARLGWLNATVQAANDATANGDALLARVIGEIRERLVERRIEVAHLKLALRTDAGSATINLVSTAADPVPGRRLPGPVAAGTVLINLRAEAAPELLEGLVTDALVSASGPDGWRLRLETISAFRPGRPVPTHRDEIRRPST
jgi:G3E family GTPase